MLLARRLAATLFVAGLGWAVAFFAGIHRFDSSSGYFIFATVLLAIGLFGCTYDIVIEVVRCHLKVILTAVTLGVLLKAILIAGVMYLAFRDNPAYLVLAVAVAQIDPLSVAVMRHRSLLSDRAKVILSTWSSFDDPVTAILTIYLSGVVLSLNAANTAVSPDRFLNFAATSVPGELLSLGRNLLGNAILVVGAAVVWFALSWISKRKRLSITDGPGAKSRGLQAAGILALVVTAVIAVGNFFMLGLAAIGLFFRPGIGRFISGATPLSFLLATFVLGVVLADGVDILPGLVLGGATFGAQIAVGILVTRSLPWSDRVRLAFGQQSGITAVVLALLLETVFPHTVAVIAPAILVINILHLISNTLLDRFAEPPGEFTTPEETPQPDLVSCALCTSPSCCTITPDRESYANYQPGAIPFCLQKSQ